MTDSPKTTVHFSIKGHGKVPISDAGHLETLLRAVIEFARVTGLHVDLAEIRRGDDIIIGTQPGVSA
jgi:hypothetical protein